MRSRTELHSQNLSQNKTKHKKQKEKGILYVIYSIYNQTTYTIIPNLPKIN